MSTKRNIVWLVVLGLCAVAATSCEDSTAPFRDAASPQDATGADASIDAGRVPVTSVASWPGGLPPGYAAGLCRVVDSWYAPTTCQLAVDCDGARKLVQCERAGDEHACLCVRSDGVNPAEQVPLPMPRFTGAQIDPCVKAFEACPDT